MSPPWEPRKGKPPKPIVTVGSSVGRALVLGKGEQILDQELASVGSSVSVAIAVAQGESVVTTSPLGDLTHWAAVHWTVAHWLSAEEIVAVMRAAHLDSRRAYHAIGNL